MQIDIFAQWLLEQGKAEKTIESYVTDVKGFQKFLKERTHDQALLSRFSFVRYKESLVERDFKIATIRKKINGLKIFNDFLRVKGIVDESYIQLKRDQVTIAACSDHHVSEKEIERLLFYVEDGNRVSARNKLIVYLLLYTGLKVSELISIKLKSIDVLTSTVRIIGKGGKHREIGLREDVFQLIQEYRKKERSKSVFSQSDYLLLSQRAQKMHRDAVRSWLAKVSKELGFTPELVLLS